MSGEARKPTVLRQVLTVGVFAGLMAAGVAVGLWFGSAEVRVPPATLPVEDAPAWTLLVVGNTGEDTATARQVRDAARAACEAQARPCDAVVLLGDLVLPGGATDPEDPRLDALVGAWSTVAPRVWLVTGDRDDGTTESRGRVHNLLAYAARAEAVALPSPTWTASLPTASLRLLALDSRELLADTPDGAALQRAWVDETLRAGTERHTLAFVHDPMAADAAALCGRASIIVHAAPTLALHDRCGSTWIAAGTGAAAGPADLDPGGRTLFRTDSAGFAILSLDGEEWGLHFGTSDRRTPFLALRRKKGEIALPDGTLLLAR